MITESNLTIQNHLKISIKRNMQSYSTQNHLTSFFNLLIYKVINRAINEKII